MNLQAKLDGKVLGEFGQTRAFVEKFLAKFPYVRDCPNFYFQELYEDWCKTYGYPISDPETIRRVRQKIQNTEQKYQPSQETKDYRIAREKAIRENIGYI